MQVLLREVLEGRDGIVEVRDSEATVDVFTIGSAPNQTLQLIGGGVAARHASIRRSGDEVRLMAGGGAVRVNGREVRETGLAAGDIVEIGRHRLTLAGRQPGFDFAIEIRRDNAVRNSEFEGAFRTSLEQLWLSKRAAAWILAATTLLLTLAVPLVSIDMKPAARDRTSPWLPTDAAWTSGPLSPAHQQAIGRNCGACHQKLFVPVRDEACRKCHESVADHISAANLQLTSFQSPGSCESCHREHGEPMSDLVIRTDGLCSDCHGEPAPRFGKLQRESASEFTSRGHPAFRTSLLVPPAPNSGTADWTIAIQPVDRATERSNLKFSHVQHLDPSRVRSNRGGEGMQCGECHTLSADGEHFVPMTMAGQCASCHELTFDAESPGRQLPHGKPLEVTLTIQEYFNRKYTDPAVAPRLRERRRLPGQEAAPPACIGPPLECARKRATAEIVEQFTRVGCAGCHVVEDTGSAAIGDRFSVVPVRLAYDYFPAAQFDHSKHAIQNDLTGDSACLSCHAAKRSRASTDVLMPGIGTCTKCHGSPGSQRDIQSACISCHVYHPQPLTASRSLGTVQ